MKLKMRYLFMIPRLVAGLPLVIALLICPEHLRPNFYVPIADRIGHYWASMLLLRARIKLGKIRNVWTFIPKRTCNRFLDTLTERELNTYPWLLYWLIQPWRRYRAIERMFIPDECADLNNISQSIEPPEFTTAEKEFCKNWLQSFGFEMAKIKIVCVYSRDSLYLESIKPHKDYSYHNYRNVDIDTYKDAVQWLLSYDPSVVVFRMGNCANDRLEIDDVRFIDYPFINNKQPIIDLWLLANSALVISPGTGPDNACHYYKVPILYANFPSLASAPLYLAYKCLIAPKQIKSKDNGVLNIQKQLNLLKSSNGLDWYSLFEQEKLLYTDLDSQALLYLVKIAWDVYILNKDPEKSLVKIKEDYIALLSHKEQVRVSDKFFIFL